MYGLQEKSLRGVKRQIHPLRAPQNSERVCFLGVFYTDFYWSRSTHNNFFETIVGVCGERLFAILENKPLREVQMFPLMRPKK